jgi:hypothetical protein
LNHCFHLLGGELARSKREKEKKREGKKRKATRTRAGEGELKFAGLAFHLLRFVMWCVDSIRFVSF